MAESRYDVGRIAQFCNLILSAESDAVRDSLAHDSAAAYRSLNADSRDAFVTFLANLQNPSIDTLLPPAPAIAPRKELFGRLGVATECVGMLIDMRSHMLNGLHNHPSWIPVEDDLANAPRTRFAPQNLEFRRVESDAEPELLASLVRLRPCIGFETRGNCDADCSPIAAVLDSFIRPCLTSRWSSPNSP